MTSPLPTLRRRLFVALALPVLLAGPIRAQSNHVGADDSGPPTQTKTPTQAEIARSKDNTQVLGFVHAYEPLKFGLTQDEGDEPFLDFSLSLMFPLYGDYADGATKLQDLSWGPYLKKHVAVFLSGTIRGGQYITAKFLDARGRPSAPVVEKRFNPQLFARLWLPGEGLESPNRFVDLIYGHESNGQSIANSVLYNRQRDIYRELEIGGRDPLTLTPAELEDVDTRATIAARDTISRGWDYLGVNASWSWKQERYVGSMKIRDYLPGGLLQQGAEQSYDWEGFGPTRPRRQYDGLTLQFTVFHRQLGEFGPVKFRRTTLSYMTGVSRPTRYNTVEADVGVTICRWPLSFWYRWGYNSNLTNYYRRMDSMGIGFSIWEFNAAP